GHRDAMITSLVAQGVDHPETSSTHRRDDRAHQACQERKGRRDSGKLPREIGVVLPPQQRRELYPDPEVSETETGQQPKPDAQDGNGATFKHDHAEQMRAIKAYGAQHTELASSFEHRCDEVVPGTDENQHECDHLGQSNQRKSASHLTGKKLDELGAAADSKATCCP